VVERCQVSGCRKNVVWNFVGNFVGRFVDEVPAFA